MHNNTGSVLKIQLIVGKFSFIFSTNDLQMSIRVFVLMETLETYIHYDFEVLNKNEGLRGSEPHFNLRLTCVNN